MCFSFADELHTIRTQPSLDFQSIREENEDEVNDEFNSMPELKEKKIKRTLKTLFEFRDGEYFGEVSLVVKIPRTATIKALEDTLLLELRKSDFQKLNDSKIKTQLERVAHERIAQGFRRYKVIHIHIHIHVYTLVCTCV